MPATVCGILDLQIELESIGSWPIRGESRRQCEKSRGLHEGLQMFLPGGIKRCGVERNRRQWRTQQSPASRQLQAHDLDYSHFAPGGLRGRDLVTPRAK